MVKLSIHWKLRSSVATAMPVGTGPAGPSGVKPEHTPEQLALMKKAAEVDAELEALEGRNDEEAERERKRVCFFWGTGAFLLGNGCVSS